ncbi:MAG: 50S ribosomal protein L13 [Candidatus Aenigmarchaeota archaeon]|nr:50S ribosomal protein L13 [Candidatus Aenigmarchaeota archaeon]MCK5321772.1 50S ribosomal protein L13 [Candidatus Aenigmarchaeota archaeon]
MQIIDGKDLVLGRLASYVAKRALSEDKETFNIINAENIVISGSKKMVLDRYKFLVEVGDIYKGPFISRMPDRLFRRAVKGMLPMNTTRGREAFKRIMAYIGESELKGTKVSSKDLEKFHKKNLKDQKYVLLKDLSELIGMKIKNR